MFGIGKSATKIGLLNVTSLYTVIDAKRQENTHDEHLISNIAMPYTVEANKDKGFVHLIYSGTVEFEERLKARDHVFELIRNEGLGRTLVETQDSSIKMTTTDIIRFAETFPTDLPDRYHVAVIVSPDDEVDHLVENMLSLRGVSIKAFEKSGEALKWLLAF